MTKVTCATWMHLWHIIWCLCLMMLHDQVLIVFNIWDVIILPDHARGLVDHTSRCARGLLRPLSDHSSMTDFLGYMWNWIHIQLSSHYFLDLATRLILRIPASSGTTSVRCTCRCIPVSSFYGVLFKTLAPRAYVTYYQARELSGHTSPCGECTYFLTLTPLMIKDATLQDTLMFLHINASGHTSQEGEIFFFSQEHYTFFGQPTSPATTLATTARIPLWLVKDIKNSSLTVWRRFSWRLSHQNTWRSGTTCGGINSRYHKMVHGPHHLRWPGP
jgi:hypothetical protein